MEGLRIVSVIFSVVIFLGHNLVRGSVLEVTARPGENITLYCDCKISTGVYIVWYRNCSHKTQPPLVLKTWRHNQWMKPLPLNFHFVRNKSSVSYDLLIQNITVSDEGFYYCGTETLKVDKIVVTKAIDKTEDKDFILHRDVYSYGNVTKIVFRPEIERERESIESISGMPMTSWMMMFTPVGTILSTFIVLILVYHFSERPGPQNLVGRPDSKIRMSQDQEEDLCLTRVVFRLQDGETNQ
ncbi:uncharacterized protein LOC115012718 [Xyrichtys novacula]|uniref:Uncharacterized protein LOC115012718 n=1 Tax=Xyrichtys novacula TaxID=13765 RepID=A0AAV1ETQ9_XYRNO|nr:uncharacterized protein LOC115012718 [Xyrichtys novacula]